MSRSEFFSAGHGADASSIVEFPANGGLQRIGPLLARMSEGKKYETDRGSNGAF